MSLFYKHRLLFQFVDGS